MIKLMPINGLTEPSMSLILLLRGLKSLEVNRGHPVRPIWEMFKKWLSRMRVTLRGKFKGWERCRAILIQRDISQRRGLTALRICRFRQVRGKLLLKGPIITDKGSKRHAWISKMLIRRFSYLTKWTWSEKRLTYLTDLITNPFMALTAAKWIWELLSTPQLLGNSHLTSLIRKKTQYRIWLISRTTILFRIWWKTMAPRL